MSADVDGFCGAIVSEIQQPVGTHLYSRATPSKLDKPSIQTTSRKRFRLPITNTSPDLKVRFDGAAIKMRHHVESTESRSTSTNRAIESVIASRSASPDSAAIAYRPECGKYSFEAATEISTTP